MRPPLLVVSAADRRALERIVRLPITSQRTALRARITLVLAAGRSVRGIATALRCCPSTVRKWARRVRARGITALQDAPRSGRPRRITAEERCSVIAAPCSTPRMPASPG